MLYDSEKALLCGINVLSLLSQYDVYEYIMLDMSYGNVMKQ